MTGRRREEIRNKKVGNKERKERLSSVHGRRFLIIAEYSCLGGVQRCSDRYGSGVASGRESSQRVLGGFYVFNVCQMAVILP